MMQPADTANDLLRTDFPRSNQLRLRVVSDSMTPWLQIGDYVVVRRVEPDNLRLGDVIVVWRNDQLITHRLMFVNQDGWWTKGDRLPKLDQPARREDVLGQVMIIERPNRKFDLVNGYWRTINRLLGYLNLTKVWYTRLRRRLDEKPEKETHA